MKTGSNIEVRFNESQAQAALAILEKLSAGQADSAGQWQALWECAGQLRLQRRESQMGSSLSEEDWRAFLRSPELLERTSALRRTLDDWLRVEPGEAGARALAYLPAGTQIRATIYPVIKPKPNSFVFELDSDPAIFLYLNPEIPAAKLANTLAHELHHVGYAAVEKSLHAAEWWQALPEGRRWGLEWLSAFGEGVAMLAAAGGPDVHPHATSPSEDRERWNRDMANVTEDLRRVEAFLVQVVSGELTGQAMMEAGMAFLGVQGAWYTVGWKMAAAIETAFGRAALIECLSDPRRLLLTYNRAASAGDAPALWSTHLVEALAGEAGV